MATVLVVDDEPINRQIAGTLLRHRGHEIIEAASGTEAIAKARSQRPDAVVTDVLMPDLDGYQLVRELRSDQDPKIAGLPVIFYTANYLASEALPVAELYSVTQIVPRDADPEVLQDAVEAALVQGPTDAVPADPDEFARQHTSIVNAKLVEKIHALHDSEARLRAMAESAPLGIVLTDTTGAAVYVNGCLSGILGVPHRELHGPRWLDPLGPEVGERIRAATRPGDQVPLESIRLPRTHIKRPDGSRRWVQIHLRKLRDSQGRPTGLVVMIDDITETIEAYERERAEQQLREHEARQHMVERMESLARMAGGLAHDYNNILAATIGYLTFAKETVQDAAERLQLDHQTAQEILDDLERCAEGSRRAARLTQQLLTFSSRDPAKPQMLDVNRILREFADRTALGLDERISLQVHLETESCLVNVDPDKIGQALREIVANAVTAMPAGGTLTISANALVDTSARQPSRQPARYVRIAVNDTGTGMEPSVANRAVEPFFTTRSSTGHMGLGLATTYGIVAQFGGELTIASVPGEGTMVSIDLPIAEEPEIEVVVPQRASSGGETVLVVDDEEDIRIVVSRILTRSGYKVLTAAGGSRALTIAEHHDGPIDCLLTDVLMPEMQGPELARRLATHRPETTVLYMSGYAGTTVDSSASLPPGAYLLSKPFTRTALLDAVRGVLGKVIEPTAS